MDVLKKIVAAIIHTNHTTPHIISAAPNQGIVLEGFQETFLESREISIFCVAGVYVALLSLPAQIFFSYTNRNNSLLVLLGTQNKVASGILFYWITKKKPRTPCLYNYFRMKPNLLFFKSSENKASAAGGAY